MNLKNTMIAIIIFFMIFLSAYFYSKSNIESQASSVRIQNKLYSWEETVEDSLKNYDSVQPASVISDINAFDKVVALTFDGMVDSETTKQILKLLEEYDSQATFFLPGIKSAEDPETVQMIASSGQEIGNYTLSAQRELDSLDRDSIINDFAKSSAVLKNITRETLTLLKVNDSDYTTEILKAASSIGVGSVVESSVFLNYQSFRSSEDAKDFVATIDNGSIITVKTDSYLNDSEYSIESSINEDRKPSQSTEDVEGQLTVTTEEKDIDKNKMLLDVVEDLLNELKEKNYEIVNITDFTEVDVINSDVKDYLALRENNNGKAAEIVSNFYTTQAAVSYTFSDITDQNKVLSVLDSLDRINAKATFFVTGIEIQEHKEIIQEIVDRGHQLANAGYDKNNANQSTFDFESVAYEIDMGDRYLKHFLGEKYDDKVNKIYMPKYGNVSELILEAASSLGYTHVYSYNRSLMGQEYQNGDYKNIIDDYFKNTYSLHRGDIVHFRIDYFKQEGAIEFLLEKVANDYVFTANYDIEPLDMLKNSPEIYQPKTRLQIAQNNDIVYSLNKSTTELNQLIMDNYIGNPNINTTEKLHGFTEKEISQINTEGKINTNGEKVIFLTFDDWGSDLAINPILDVLNKYDAKASFFVRVGSQSVDLDDNFQNPNLLRAIALDGHDVENHSFKHITVDIESDEQVEMVQKDLLAAQYELERYLYDTGAIHNYFRPPTLAVSKLGLETIFNMGFDYIINGNLSTPDYKAASVEQLTNDIMYGLGEGRTVEEGTIIVMHMSDQARYTAEALDIVIPYFIKQGYEFARLSDYLVDGYIND